MPLIDLAGKTFTRLTVVSRAENSPGGAARWLCRCSCGTPVTVLGTHLRKGSVKSCGCLRRDNASKLCRIPHRKPAVPGKTTTPEYSVYAGMKAKCYNPNRAGYKSYGAVGIRVCDRWLESFENFLSDMGPRPGAGYVLWRLGKALGFTPANCIWSTREIEARKAAKLRRYGV